MSRYLFTNARIAGHPGADTLEVVDGVIAGFSRSTTPDHVFDLGGLTLMPSFADAHVHLRTWAAGELMVDLSGTRCLDEALERLRRASEQAPPGEWLRARYWNRNAWEQPSWPDRGALDRACGGRPVVVESLDLHACWASSAALEAAGLGGPIEGEPAGVMLREGRASGILREDAAWRLVERIPPPGKDALAGAIRRVCRKLYECGVTAVTDVDGLDAARTYCELGEPLRILASVRASELEAGVEPWRIVTARLQFGTLKLFLDGSLGSRSAWMLEPFCTEPREHGMATLSGRPLREIARRALSRGWGLAIHAIGDAANREALDLFEELRPDYPEAMLRVEHAQLLAAQDVPRFGALGVWASMQPSHILDDVKTADREWGARSRLAYPFASLAATGARLAFGSDVPVGDPDPRAGLRAAIRRQDRAGRPPGGWYPHEVLPAASAIEAYTAGAQEACGLGPKAGRLVAGAPADLIAVEGSVPDFEVRGTWIAGEPVSSKSG